MYGATLSTFDFAAQAARIERLFLLHLEGRDAHETTLSDAVPRTDGSADAPRGAEKPASSLRRAA